MKILLSILLISLTLMLSSCNKEKALIFFSSKPISSKSFTLNKAEVNFKVGQKIYFVMYNPKPFTSDILRLQVLKIDQKHPAYTTSIEHGRDIGIDIYNKYVTDYFILHVKGYYILRIFSPDDYFKPIAQAEFKVD